MASISLLNLCMATTTTTTNRPNTVPSACPLYKLRRQAPTMARHGVHKVSRGARDGEEEASSLAKFDRRNVLIGLGGLYTATGLGNVDQNAIGAPIPPPDLSKCKPIDVAACNGKLQCCPPYDTPKIVPFQFPSPSSPMRIRRPAHLLEKDYIAKYNKAISLMKALPYDDPRNFVQQAKVHCAYCDGAYQQVGCPALKLQIHSSWLFFPWHRCYLYFYEKILGKLINDEEFALPFWSWDTPEGMHIPSIFTETSSSLYDILRDGKHQPPTVANLDYNGDLDEKSPIPPDKLIKDNLTVMYNQVVGKTAELFMGSACSAGSFELVPHNTMHDWTGDRDQPNRENMGVLYAAARDPIFFAHHSNVDRIWTLWKQKFGGRDFDNDDWLNTAFLFYNENKDLVEVKVRDFLDTETLRYRYEDIDIPWKDSGTPARKAKALAGEARKDVVKPTDFPLTLDKVIKVWVQRPKKSRSKEEKEKEEEILVIEGIELERDVYLKFDVYINDEDDAVLGPAVAEFAGSFVNLPRSDGKPKALRLGITNLLKGLKAEEDDTILVTLVLKTGKGNVTIDGIKIE